MPSAPPVISADNVILTGIARSGTTLACALLNRLPQVVALNEPIAHGQLVRLPSRQAVADEIGRAFAAQRASLLARGEAASRVRDGQIPANLFGEEPDPLGQRHSLVACGVVRVHKPLCPAFRLVIKHPSCFTALLDVLVARFRCFATVRNPLAVLLSWHTTMANWNRGRQPAAEAFDDGLRRRLDREPDTLGRQLQMLAWSFGQYAQYLPRAAVLRYEDLVASGGTALTVIDPAAAQLSECLGNRNDIPIYRTADVAGLADRVLGTDGPWWEWYRREEVARLAHVLGA